MNSRVRNPFIYGRPVPTGRFYGRQAEVRTLFSRLFNGESTAIVGEPHIGKSSLLRYIADEKQRREWISDVFEQHIFADFDCHLMSGEFTAADFWKHVLEQVLATTDDEALRKQCELVAQNSFGSLTLERVFKLLGKRSWRLVLLIDEFDALLNHSHFSTAEFLGALRSFATRTDGLAVITASRLSVSQMNRLSVKHNPFGSPFFNNMTEVRLSHLSDEEAQRLIGETLAAAGPAVAFDDEDRKLLLILAGRQPFLLQVAAASLYDAYVERQDKAGAHALSQELFHERSTAHFEDLQRTLESNSTDVISDADRIDRAALREKLVKAFDNSELQTLCFDLGVDYDELSVSGKSALAVQLILFCQRRGLIGRLRDLCETLRPGF